MEGWPTGRPAGPGAANEGVLGPQSGARARPEALEHGHKPKPPTSRRAVKAAQAHARARTLRHTQPAACKHTRLSSRLAGRAASQAACAERSLACGPFRKDAKLPRVHEGRKVRIQSERWVECLNYKGYTNCILLLLRRFFSCWAARTPVVRECVCVSHCRLGLAWRGKSACVYASESRERQSPPGSASDFCSNAHAQSNAAAANLCGR